MDKQSNRLSSTPLFASLLQLERPNAVLSRRLVQLFQLSFGADAFQMTKSREEESPLIVTKQKSMQTAAQTTRKVVIERVAVDEEFKTCRVAHPNPSSLIINTTKVKSRMLGATAQDNDTKDQQRNPFTQLQVQQQAIISMPQPQHAKLTPRNIQLLLDFFDFASRCPYPLDQDLGRLLEGSLAFGFSANVTGFSGNEKMREGLLARVACSINRILANSHIQSSVHDMVIDFICNSESVIVKSIEAKLGQVDIVPQTVLSTDGELGAISTLCRHLSVTRKKQLCKLASDALFNPPKSQDEHPDPQKQLGLKSLLSSQKQMIPDSQALVILKVLTSLLQSPIRVHNGEIPFEQDREYQIGEEHLLEDRTLTQLQKLCLSKFQKLFSGRIRSQSEFSTFLDPYCKLLFQLIFVKEAKDDLKQKSMFRKINLGRGLDSMKDSVDEDGISALELLSLVIRTCLNKMQPDITVDQMRQFLQTFLLVCRDQALSSRESTTQSDTFCEIFDTLACYCTKVNMSRVNQELYDSIHLESNESSERSSFPSEERTTMGSSNAPSLLASSLKHFIANMQDSSLFEEVIAQLIRIELEMLAINANSGGQKKRFEQSATCHLIKRLINACQQVPSQSEALPKLISYTASFTRLVIKARPSLLKQTNLAKIKGQVTILLQRVFQCIKRQSETNAGVLDHASNVIQLAMADLQEVTDISDVFPLFLNEFHELFQKRSIMGTFADISSTVFNIMANFKVEKLRLSDEIRRIVDQRVHFLQVFTTILNTITLEDPKIFSTEKTVKMLRAIVACFQIEQSSWESSIAFSQEVTDDLKSHFMHLWVFVAQQETESVQMKSVLGPLARLTPASCFSEEFINLELRAEAKNVHLESFSTQVVRSFQEQIDSLGSQASAQKLSNGVSLLEQSQITDASPSQPNKAKKAAAKQIKEQDEEEHDEEDELQGSSAHLTFNEKVYLAIFILIQTHRLSENGLSSLPFVKDTSLVQSTIAAFEREKALIANDFSNDKNLGEPTVLCKCLGFVAKSLFAMHVKALKGKREKGEWTASHNKSLVSDFSFLVQNSCSGNSLIRDLAAIQLERFDSSFPGLVLLPGALESILDVVSALHKQLNSTYDGRGHLLSLILSKSQTILPSKEDQKVEALSNVLKLLQHMLLKGAILDQTTLLAAYESFQSRYMEALASLNRGAAEMNTNFGTTYTSQLLSQLDLSKVDLGRSIANFSALRSLADTDPLGFKRIVEALQPQAFNRDRIGLKDFSQLIERGRKDQIEAIRPFQMTPPEVKPVKVNGVVSGQRLSMTSMSLREAESQAGGLVDQALEALMQLDQIKAVQYLNGFVDGKKIARLLRSQVQQVHSASINRGAVSEETAVLYDRHATNERQRNMQRQRSLSEDSQMSIRDQAKSLRLLDPQERLSQQATRLVDTLEKLIQFAVNLPISVDAKSDFKTLASRLITVVTYIPAVAHCKQTVGIYSNLATSLSHRPDLMRVFVESLPFAVDLLASKIEMKSRASAKQKVRGIFEVFDRVKSSVKASQKGKNYAVAEDDAIENRYDFLSTGSKHLFECLKLHSLPGQIQSDRHVVETLETLMDTVFDSRILHHLIQGNQIDFSSLLQKCLQRLIYCLQKTIKKLTDEPKLCKVVLKTLKNGFSLSPVLKDLSFDRSLTELVTQSLRVMHQFNYRRTEHSSLMQELQIVEDLKYLLSQNKEVFAAAVSEQSSSKAGFDARNSTSAFLPKRNNQRSQVKVVRSCAVEPAVFAQITTTAIQSIKMALVANNCKDLMDLAEIDPLQPYLTQQQSENFAAAFPRLALTLATKHSAQFKFLLKPILTEIEKAPSQFMRCKEALHLFLGQKMERFANSTMTIQNFAFWRIGHILHLIQFIALKHQKSEVASTFALKTLYYAEPKTVIFFLPQLFQSLRTDKSNRILQFLLKRSRESASIAHNVLWLCKVESVLEQGTGRKVQLPFNETLHTITSQLYEALLADKNMGQCQRSFFETETNFFEKITSISGLLQPSQSKDEKKAIIREKLIEYNQEVPECVYLPTNQTCRVVGIVTNSGQPMQSAARVPILISFEVEDYPGPDRDPILQDDTLVASVIRQTCQNQRAEPVEDLTWAGISSNLVAQRTETSQERRTAEFDGSDIQEKTQCDRISDYQMNIRNGAHNSPPLSLSNVIETEDKAPMINLAVLKSQHDTVTFQEAQAQQAFTPGEDRTVRSKYLKELQAPFREAVGAGQRDQAFSGVAKMLTNMQDATTNARDRKRQQAAGGSSRVVAKQTSKNPQLAKKPTKVISCIFKVNDDLRQDILALQVIKIFQKIFKKCDLDLYVVPYKCVSNRTGDERLLGGIIECIPNSYSRDQLGKAYQIDLHKYFLKRYGSETSKGYEEARLNFTKSLAAYCVVSYILQIKDRHNGNIMIDESGHLIHIDFGFIFDWSPGRDMRFESANFKLTQEFIDILGGDPSAEAFKFFVSKVQQGFLAVREHAAEIQNLVELMWYSGYPCFKPVSLDNLQMRFMHDLNDFQAARFMQVCVEDARDKWTTRIYDFIQSKQNKIFF